MKVIAIRQLHGTLYGSRFAGEEFEVPYYIGIDLLKAKVVRTPEEVEYQVKAIQPSAPAVTPEHPEPKIANKKR